MRGCRLGLALAAAIASAVGARAAPRVEIRGAAAHVVVIPEARTDIVVSVIGASSRFPLKISRSDEVTFIDGDVGHRVRGCPLVDGKPGVRIRGIGQVEGDSLPRLAIHTPMNVKITTGDGVSGAIGRANSLDFENRGCGQWTIANVRGNLRVNEIGSGGARAGGAGTADLSVAGAGVIAMRAIRGPLTAVSSGAGAITVDSVSGVVIVRIAGSGSVGVNGGIASQLNVSIAGSGAARFGGEARSVNASVTGPGYVSIARATGPVTRRLFGAGQILVGR
jgi:hypothetical protein